MDCNMMQGRLWLQCIKEGNISCDSLEKSRNKGKDQAEKQPHISQLNTKTKDEVNVSEVNHQMGKQEALVKQRNDRLWGDCQILEISSPMTEEDLSTEI